MLLDILNNGDLCSLSAVVLILLWVGRILADQTEQKVGFGFAGVAFLAYTAYAFLFHPPRSAEELLWITVRSVIAFGGILGLSWIVVPLLAGFYRRTLGAMFDAVRQWWASIWQRAAGRRLRHREELNRRLAHEQYERAAPERERAQRKAEEDAKRQFQAQKRRDDARTACELLYHRHAHVLAGRFPKEVFEEYVRKYLGDERLPEYVEERAQQLQEIMREHVEQTDPPQTPFTIDSLATWYETTKQLIQKLPVDDRYKHVQMAHLNARYTELMQTLMETLRP